MGLRIRRAPSKKVQLLTTLFAAFALVAQPTAMILQSISASAISLTPDTSNIKFKGSPKYVRESNAGDVGAQLMTYNTTTNVNFYIDGDMGTPVPGVREGVTGAVYDEWRLKTPLAAGEYSVTAKVEIGGDWYTASGSGKIYSIDMPWASYVAPTDQNHFFRPSDNPLRLKIDDEFEQFDRASFSLYDYDTVANKFGSHIDSFTVNRSECDTRAAGRYVLCDISRAADWKNLNSGSYAVKLTTHTKANSGIRTHMSDYWSRAFTIDSTAPVITSFNIEGSTTVGGNSLKVAATAIDNHIVESMNFYVTEPRNDGVCTGNGSKIAEQRVYSPDTEDSKYRATLNIAGLKSDAYCVMAVARDKAMGNSDIVRLMFNIDHTPPTVTIQSTGSIRPMASTDSIVLSGKVNGNFSSMVLMQDGTPVTARVDMNTGEWSYTLPKDKVTARTYHFVVVAEDAYGNKSTEARLVVSANPFVPGRSAVPPSSLENPSTLSLITPSLFTTPASLPLGIIQPDEAEDNTTDVLGAETANKPVQSSDLPAVAATESGWKIFGIAWYWLALILVVVASGAWWTAANVRRRRAAELA